MARARSPGAFPANPVSTGAKRWGCAFATVLPGQRRPEVLVEGSLVQLVQGKGRGLLLPIEADFRVDALMQTRARALLSLERVARLVAILAGHPRVFWTDNRSRFPRSF